MKLHPREAGEGVALVHGLELQTKACYKGLYDIYGLKVTVQFERCFRLMEHISVIS